jgi:hypothetical protein
MTRKRRGTSLPAPYLKRVWLDLERVPNRAGLAPAVLHLAAWNFHCLPRLPAATCRARNRAAGRLP